VGLQEAFVFKRRWFVVLAVIYVVFGAGPSASRQTSRAPAPGLQGAWQQEHHSGMLIATPAWVAFVGVDALPAAAKYTIEGSTITLQPVEAAKSFEDQILENDLGIRTPKANAAIVLERFEQRGETISFVTPDGVTLTWRRLE
jgi:hypothetical protein